MTRKLKIVFSLFVIIAAAIFAAYRFDLLSFFEQGHAVGKNEATDSVPGVKVLAQPVVFTPESRVLETVGTGKARQSVNIYPSVDEEVIEVFFKAQQKVEKGDILVQLDDREEQLAKKLARVKLKDTRSILNRYEQAVKEGAVPESEVDSARAEMESAQVALEQAELAILHRKVIAPVSGFVGIPRIDPGDRVTTGTLITGLDDRKVLFVDFEVPEALAGVLEENQKITAKTPAYPNRTFEGTITALESRVDPQTRTIMARANIENSDDLLRPGMSFTTVWKKEGQRYPTVPEIALEWSNEGSFVWIVRDGRAVKVKTIVIARNAGKVLVEGDITEGEPIVVEGLERLNEGTEVTILRVNEEQKDTRDQN